MADFEFISLTVLHTMRELDSLYEIASVIYYVPVLVHYGAFIERP